MPIMYSKRVRRLHFVGIGGAGIRDTGDKS